MLSHLNIGDVAKMLGVSASTVKRMCDEGTIPYARTTGGHRRFDPTALETAAQKIKGLSVHELAAPARKLTVDEIMAKLIDGDFRVLSSRVSSSRTALETLQLFDEALAPALYRVIQQWQWGSIDHYQSQMAVDVARRLLAVLSERIQTSSHKPWLAIGGTIADDYDDLASRMAEIGLRLVPVPTLYLGSNLSAQALASAANDFNAKLIWVCHAHLSDTRLLLDWHRQLRELLPPSTRVMVGGSALTPAFRYNLPPHDYFATMTELFHHMIAWMQGDFEV